MKNKRLSILLAIAFIFFISMDGETQESVKLGKSERKVSKREAGFSFARSNSPIDILSDTVEANQKQSIITFKGNVVAKQEEITLYTDMLIVLYDPDTKKIREVQAKGNVKIVQLQRRATCQKAIFYQQENKVILEGDVVIREDDNVVRGERVTYYLDEERSIVEAGKGGRVSTSIVPSSEEAKKK